MIGAYKSIAGVALALTLALTPQIASARDHDGGGRHGGGLHSGGHAEGRSYAGRGGHAFNANNGGGRGFAERARDFGRRDFGGRRYDGYRGYSRPYYSRGYGGWRGYRSWGPRYFVGFGSYYDDYRAWPYYGLAAWEMDEYAALSEAQVRAQEDAMIAATASTLNDPIAWNDGAASGSVTPLRDGTTEDGKTCREFQQEITVDGKRQRAFGTACREPDGSWKMVEE